MPAQAIATSATTALDQLLQDKPQWFWRGQGALGGSGVSSGVGSLGVVCAEQRVLGTGWAQLDAQLPGGGWPLGAVTELLVVQPAQLEWRLLAAALQVSAQGSALQTSAQPVMLINPPMLPFAPGIAQAGVAANRLLWVQPGPGALAQRQALWATEQALQCAGLAAVLAWLPQALPEQMRRLQSRAQAFEGLCVVIRPESAQLQASAAPLRVLARLNGVHEGGVHEGGVHEGAVDVHQPGGIQLQILKRRGPPCELPLHLPAWPQALAVLQPGVDATPPADPEATNEARIPKTGSFAKTRRVSDSRVLQLTPNLTPKLTPKRGPIGTRRAAFAKVAKGEVEVII